MSEKIIKREACEACVASGGDIHGDNKVVYDDGSWWCYACNDGSFPRTVKTVQHPTLISNSIADLSSRGINKDTTSKYSVTSLEGKLIFPVFKNGKLIKQKLRQTQAKEFTQLGDTKTYELFGQDLFSPSLNIPIVCVEGELDALAAHQMTGLPCVSVFRGAAGAKKELAENLEWLNGFKHIIICFDNDDPGIKAANDCVALFEPGRVKIATLPLKDANDMLLAGRQEDFKKCLWNANIVKPDTIVFPDDIRAEALTKPKLGVDWPWPSLTKITYGFRFGELYHVFGPTNIGKTEFTEEIVQWLITQNIHCGIFSIEQRPADRLRRMLSKRFNKRLYLPGVKWPAHEALEAEIDYLKDKVAFYDATSGVITIDRLLINMRYLNTVYKTKFFILDNLKALSVNPFIDGKVVPDYAYMSHIVSKMFLISRELNVTIMIINHVRKSDINVSAKVSSYDEHVGWDPALAVRAEGLTWETGLKPTSRDIYGGGNINDLVDFTLALSRNAMSADANIKRKLYIECLKNKIDSKYTGYMFAVDYHSDTGRLIEAEDT